MNVKISELEHDKLDRACARIIDSLKDFSPEYKIVALHICMKSFPVDYVIIEDKKNE